jgi:hypothetical protein
MLATRAETVVNVPVGTVFSYLADLPHIYGTPKDVDEQTSRVGVGVGSTFVFGPGPWVANVTELVTDKQMVWDEIFGVGRRRSFIKVEPVDGATRLTMGREWVSFTAVGKVILMPLVLLPLIRPLASWGQRRMVRRLKERMESEAHRDP